MALYHASNDRRDYAVVMREPVDVATCFSPNYAAARASFLAVAAERGLAVRSYPNPRKGPEDEVLATDVAWLGPADARRVLVLLSATHGVEGFCGSGAQIDWIHNSEPEDLPSDIGVLIVHAINPYGFAWLRRVTEEGTDLNRNWIDFDQPLPPNEAYEEIADTIVPATLDGPDFAAAEERLRLWRTQKGEQTFQVALNAGQYTHPNGLYYGGREPAWARRTTERIIEDHRLSAREVVGVIDYHTGLGPYGYGEPICGHCPGTSGQKLTRDWYGEDLTEPFLGTSSSVPIVGLSQYGWLRLLGDRVAFIALEFGTWPPEVTFRALQADHWLHAHGQVNWHDVTTRSIKASLRRAFYPDEDDWREMVLSRSRQIIHQALQGLERCG